MKIFVVLCFSLRLVGSSKGMSFFVLCFIKHSILHGVSPVLYNLDMFQRFSHFLFKLSEVKFRHSFQGTGLIYIHPSLFRSTCV